MNLRHGATSVFVGVSSLLLLVLPIAKAQQPQSSGSSSQKSSASEQTATMQPAPRITQAIDDSSVVRIPRTTHPLATPVNDRGRADADLPMNRIVLVLKPSALQQTALSKLIDSQHDQESPNFQHWLTPEQYAAQFAPAQSDLEQITSWLRQHNFTVASIARGGQWIEFSGTAGQVEAAFHTEIHNYVVDGKPHVANAADISLPQALAPVVSSVLSLHDFRPKPLHTGGFQVRRDAATGKLMPVKSSAGANPQFSPPGLNQGHFLAPGDWSRVYSTAPLLGQNITGAGISIAIVGSDSDIQLSDVRAFRQIFQLPAKDPLFIIDGPDPGILAFSEAEEEADLDVEWSGAVAPEATINFVTAASTFSTFGAYFSISHIIDNRVAPIMSSSIGSCEAFLGTGGNAFLNAAYQQAAAEGISIFVAAGDTGAAGCDPQESPTPAINGQNVSGFASTPYNVAMGGTMFAESGLDANYWQTTNLPDFSSVIGYIPEAVWNESCDPTVDPTQCGGTFEYFLVAGGGGPSNCTQSTVQITQSGETITCQSGYPKPSWQAGKGVPNDGARDLPDLALASGGGRDGYLLCVEGSCQTTTSDGQTALIQASVVGGTSAAAPSMSGLMALIEQKTGAYQGLVNYNFYKLAAAENLSACNSSHMTNPNHPSACIFNDVTSGNNNVSGQPGYNAGTGYDMASGLGSLNAENLLNSWSSITKLPTTTKILANTVQVQHGQPIPMIVAVKPSSANGVPTGDVAFITSIGDSLSGGTLVNGSFSGNVTGLPGGNYQVKARYSGDAMFASSTSGTVNVRVSPEDSTVNVQPIQGGMGTGAGAVQGSGPVFYGTPFGLQIDVQGKSGTGSATGTVTVQMDHKLLGTFPLNASGSSAPGTNGYFFGFEGLNSTAVPVGKHTFTVSYSGDNSFNPSIAAPYTLQVIKALGSTSLITVQQIFTAGVPINFVLAAFPYGPTGAEALPTGTVQLYDCGPTSSQDCLQGKPISEPITLSSNGPFQLTGPASVPGSQARYGAILSAGSHYLKVAYSGDANYDSIPAGSFAAGVQIITVNPSSGMTAKIAVKQSPGTITLGQSESYIVSVKPSQANKPMPTGTVSLSDQYQDFLGAPIPLTNGNASIVVPWFYAGSELIYVNYSGDSNYTPLNSAVLGTTVVQQGNPFVVLTASPPAFEFVLLDGKQQQKSTAQSGSSVGNITENTNVVLTVSVQVPPNANISSPVAEGGQVEFFDSVNGVAAQMLGFGPRPLTLANGGNQVATLSVKLPPGFNLISAVFLGTPEWAATASFDLIGYNVTAPPSPQSPVGWSWMSGSSIVDQPGIYGTLGSAAPGNTPGARQQAASWTDSSGDFWLFGGYGAASSTTVQQGDLNDLWKYSGGEWVWMGGSDSTEQQGNYGTKGSAAADNIPGARYQAVSWTDAAGNFWLFGGLGLDSTGSRGRLNDLWKYSGGEWTWISGSKLADQKGKYGTQGTAAPANVPGGRVDAASWTDSSGNLWLFGGAGWDSTGTIGILNDLWKYSAGKWTWMSGSNTISQVGTYGTKGTAAPGNVPGARANPSAWVDASGNLWLFGGEGLDLNGTLCEERPSPCDLNDLWKYSAGEWTWMGGSDVVQRPGVYGTQGVAAHTNTPGARDTSAVWIDASGTVWLFGGFGYDSTGSYGYLNDLWKFSGGEWTWVSGSNLGGQAGTYGVLGTTTATNVPGARYSAMSWIDSSGNLWLFGGTDYPFSILDVGKFNDLWEYKP